MAVFLGTIQSQPGLLAASCSFKRADAFSVCPYMRDAIEFIKVNIVGAYMIKARGSDVAEAVEIILREI